jgi:hypothetical protein
MSDFLFTFPIFVTSEYGLLQYSTESFVNYILYTLYVNYIYFVVTPRNFIIACKAFDP